MLVLLPAASFVTPLVMSGCGGDDDQKNPAGGGDGGAAAGTAGTTATAGGTAGVSAGNGGSAGSAGAPPEWGIGTRPTNQTCKAPPSRNEAAPLLSKTGCVDATDPKKPSATLIPYDVASPLWSDAATKYRYIALPDTGKIKVKDCAREPAGCKTIDQGGTYPDEGDWDFPDGTVFVKTFALGTKLIETRLLIRIDQDNWWGFSYQWRDDQSDADLLASNLEGYDVDVTGPNGVQKWHFPSRQQCLQCHTTAAGVSLGLETSQLNFDFTYPNGVKRNQLNELAHIDAFETAPAELPVFSAPSDQNASLDTRARAYLHSNCANCHRAGSNFPNFDISFDTPLKDTKLCNVVPEKGTMGVDGAMRLVPGTPQKSMLSLRMHSLDPSWRMPQIGTRVVDESGASLIDAWITSLQSCP